jgi:hypothetical protein
LPLLAHQAYGRPMNRLFVLATLSLAAVPATAHAAAKPGSYSGTTSGKYVQVGQAEEPTDKGKVTFKVRSGKVLDFKVRGQLFQCGPPAELLVTVKTIKLSASGKGKATFEDPNVGKLAVSITVSAKGKATGTVKAAPAAGLCNPDYPVRFTAKRR